MTEFDITIWASCIGAGIGSVFSLVGMLINSWLTQRRERRQQVWQTEINRFVGLEERAGQMVEWIGSYNAIETVLENVANDLTRLQSDAGRFRRHRGIMQAIRDLHNGLSRLLDDKANHRDWREVSTEVDLLYTKLLAECDKVTGKRRL